MVETQNSIALLSINQTAKILRLGKDTIYRLVADGKIGYIAIGKRKKIPYQELIRFQKETIMRAASYKQTQVMSSTEVGVFLRPGRKHKKLSEGHSILQSIMR